MAHLSPWSFCAVGGAGAEKSQGVGVVERLAPRYIYGGIKVQLYPQSGRYSPEPVSETGIKTQSSVGSLLYGLRLWGNGQSAGDCCRCPPKCMSGVVATPSPTDAERHGATSPASGRRCPV